MGAREEVEMGMEVWMEVGMEVGIGALEWR